MFTSLNQYQNVQVLRADNPEELCNLINQITVPIKILGFDSWGNKFFAYISGDVKIKKVSNKNLKKME